MRHIRVIRGFDKLSAAAGVILMLLLLLGLAEAALAGADAAGWALGWWTADSGGGLNIASGSYALSGTAGQPDAAAASAVGSYQLMPGYWPGAEARYKSYLPIMVR